MRYFRLRGTNINELSRCIGNLRALQTHNVYSIGDSAILLPDEICNTNQLRYLIGHFNWPFRVNGLTNFQTLNFAEVDDCMELHPLDLINLCELYVFFAGKEKIFTLDYWWIKKPLNLGSMGGL